VADIRIKGLDRKYHIHRNMHYVEFEDADNPQILHKFYDKSGTLNVGTTGEVDCGEFDTVNVTVREYTQEMENDHNETLDIVNDLLTIIGEMEDDGNADNQEGIEETDSEQSLQ